MKKPTAPKEPVFTASEQPTFEELRLFVLVWRAIQRSWDHEPINSIRQLAKAANVSHVAVIDNLNRIERKYGTKLLDRESFALTFVGEAVYQWGSQIVNLYEKGQVLKAQGLTGVRVGLGSFPTLVLAVELIHALPKHLPELVDVEFSDVAEGQVPYLLEKGTIDVWFGIVRDYLAPHAPFISKACLTNPIPLMAYHQANTFTGPLILAEDYKKVGSMGDNRVDLLFTPRVRLPRGIDCLAALGDGGLPGMYYGPAYRIQKKDPLPKAETSRTPTEGTESSFQIAAKDLRYTLPKNVTATLTTETADPVGCFWRNRDTIKVQPLLNLLEALAWAIW